MDLLLSALRLWVTCIVYLIPSVISEAPKAYLAVEQVKEGGMLSFVCEYKNFQPGIDVAIARRTSGKVNFQRLTTLKHIRHDIDDERMFIAERQSDSDKSYLFSIVDVDKNRDEGAYKCELISDTVTSSSEVQVLVEHFPESVPECTPSGPVTVKEGQLAEFNCTAENGHPTVTLSWNREKSDANQKMNKTHTYLVLETSFSATDSTPMLICTVESTSFPDDAARVCQIGPITIVPNPNYNPDADHPVPDKPPEDALITPEHSDCEAVCSIWDSRTNIWRISTFVSAAIALLLILITIVFCTRFRTVSQQRRVEVPRRVEEDEVFDKVEQIEYTDGRVYMPLKMRDDKPECLLVIKEVDSHGYTRTPKAHKPMFS